jgi:chemotaxis protein MotA
MQQHLSPWHRHLGSLTVVGVIALALAASHIPLASWAHPAGWVLVLGGTFAATLLSHSLGDWHTCWQRLQQATPQPMAQRVANVQQLAYGFAHQARKFGLLTLQEATRDLQTSPQPDTALLAQGLELVLDNLPPDTVQERLTTTLETTYQHQLDSAKLLEAAAGYAPTMGLLGALLGLMSALSQPLTNLALATTGVAQAFSATLLGVALANLVLQPLAQRLKREAKRHWLLGTLQLQTVVSLQAGEHPSLLREKLSIYSPAPLPTVAEVLPEAPAPAVWQPAPVAERHPQRPEQAPRARGLASSLPSLASSQGERRAELGLQRPLPSAGGKRPRVGGAQVSPGRAAMLGSGFVE